MTRQSPPRLTDSRLSALLEEAQMCLQEAPEGPSEEKMTQCLKSRNTPLGRPKAVAPGRRQFDRHAFAASRETIYILPKGALARRSVTAARRRHRRRRPTAQRKARSAGEPVPRVVGSLVEERGRWRPWQRFARPLGQL